MPSARDLLPLLGTIRRHLEAHLTLQTLAARAGWSPFHLHRAFRRMTGETPKRYVIRLRLIRAAGRLLTTRRTIAAIAVEAGFASHEVFTRAFRRHFGRSPAAFRRQPLARAETAVRRRHAAIAEASGACLGLFHMPTDPTSRRERMPTLTIERRELAPQPVLFIRRRVAMSDLQTTLADCFGKVYTYCHTVGAALAGNPYTRYTSTGPGLMTIEAGAPLAAPAAGSGEIEAGELPGGPAAVAVHGGPYDQLKSTYVDLERWMESTGVQASGPPWEKYVTDPAEHPNPEDWRTEVVWPLAT